MFIYYKIDVLEELKNKGYSTYRIRKENILGEATMKLIREKKSITLETLGKLCKILEMQPGDIIGYKED